MADKSAIEWTDATWNPIVGCSIVSPGCTNCYAMKMAGRIEAMGGAKHYAGTTRKVNGKARGGERSEQGGKSVWTGKLAMAPEKTLLQPLAWRAPRRIFVNSMGDLFHEDVPDEWIDTVFAVMALAPQHTFQVLTKRAKRMREYFIARRPFLIADSALIVGRNLPDGHPCWARHRWLPSVINGCTQPASWPLPNVWLGVSAERQQEADERIPELLATPAAIRFVSAEPLLGPINFVDAIWAGNDPPHWHMFETIDWIIVGGESGPDARPMHPAWPRAIRDQCQAAGVQFFFKQWGAWAPGEWSLDLDDRCQFTPLDPAVPVHGLADHDRAQHRVHWWDDDKVPEGLGSLRVAKKAAGRLLDGIEHNAFPLQPVE